LLATLINEALLELYSTVNQCKAVCVIWETSGTYAISHAPTYAEIFIRSSNRGIIAQGNIHIDPQTSAGYAEES